jgi:hypothetical protein
LPISGAFALLTSSTSATWLPSCFAAPFLNITTPMPTCTWPVAHSIFQTCSISHFDANCYAKSFERPTSFLKRHESEDSVASVYPGLTLGSSGY